MRTVFIFHGIGGNAIENWFPWLKQELEQDGSSKVIVPEFPHAVRPTLSAWLTHFDQYREQVSASSIFIGHSLGVSFALRLLESLPVRIRASFLVSGFLSSLNNMYGPLVQNFVEEPFDLPSIKEHCREFQIFHGDNDPFVSLEKAHELSKALHGTLHFIPKGGHLNVTSGYTTFPELLSCIRLVMRD